MQTAINLGVCDFVVESVVGSGCIVASTSETVFFVCLILPVWKVIRFRLSEFN